MQLPLQIFEDEERNRIRTFSISGEVWFHGLDVCAALDLKNPSDAFSRLDEDEKRTLGSAEGSTKVTRGNPLLISESGLYNLIFQSRKPNAKRFRKWVTGEVLPQIRKSGQYSIVAAASLPVFVRRFNDNWDRVETGYFSVIGELFIRVYGRLEHVGYLMPDKGTHKKEMRPDVSVGIRFSEWLKLVHPTHCAKRKDYRHLLPNGLEVEAYQYHSDSLSLFIQFVDFVWLPVYSEAYFAKRDPGALPYLPKLLPVNSVPPKAAANKFTKVKQMEIPKLDLPQQEVVSEATKQVASEESARGHFSRMKALLRKPE